MNAQIQKRLRANWLKRSEWNLLLLASICALLAASPAAGASLAASSLAVSSLTTASTPNQYKAVLWWLQNSAAGASERALGFTSKAGSASFALDAVGPEQADAQQVAAWIATLKDSLPPAATNEIILPSTLSVAQQDKLTSSYTLSSYEPDAVHHLAIAASPIHALRYDASRRFVTSALTSHEAITLSGTRTNSYLE